MGFVEVAFDGGVIDGAVHSLDVAVIRYEFRGREDGPDDAARRASLVQRSVDERLVEALAGRLHPGLLLMQLERAIARRSERCKTYLSLRSESAPSAAARARARPASPDRALPPPLYLLLRPTLRGPEEQVEQIAWPQIAGAAVSEDDSLRGHSPCIRIHWSYTYCVLDKLSVRRARGDHLILVLDKIQSLGHVR
jgi:hypothetical protein